MPENLKPIVVVGSINMDLVVRSPTIPRAGETVMGGDFQTHPGGKGANQAVAVARLGYLVAMIGRTGDDAFGERLREGLREAGVGLEGVLVSHGPSGVAMIVVSDAGENCIVVAPGANALLTPSDLDAQIETIRGAAMVLAQLEVPMVTVEHLALLCEREGVPLMLDPAPAAELSPELLRRVTWFTPNETEAAFFDACESGPEAVAARLLERGPTGVVLKLGARGAYVLSREGVQGKIASFDVKTCDSTAAGDTFNGAFATALAQHHPVLESARFAAAAAALSVTRAGAQPSMPTMHEVTTLLDGGSR